MTLGREEGRMDKAKQRYLEAKGWKVGGADEFLQLRSEEKEYIELKLALARKVREHRQKRNLTQVEMARLVGSSQSRVAKIEAGDPSVSFDLLIRSLIALGATQKELARVINPSGH
jgi:DNA-binding XRE family transcriptional regulator